MRQIYVKQKHDRTRPRSDLLVEDKKHMTSHRPKTVLSSKTEEGSRQSEAKETIEEKMEHADLRRTTKPINK
ncbi:unnamed protein product [Brassica oleracea]